MFGKKKSEPSREPGKRKGAELMNQMGFGAMPGLSEMDAMVYGDDDDDDDLEAELAALAGDDYEPPARSKPKRKAPMAMGDIEKMAAMGMQDISEDVSDTEDPDLLAELQELGDETPSPPTKSPNLSPQKSPSPKPAPRPPPAAAPSPQMYTPTLPSPAATPSPVPQNLPSPQNRPAVAPRASPSPAASPGPSASPAGPSPTPKPSSARGMVGLLEERAAMYKQASANAKALGDASKQRRLDRGIKTLAGLLRQAKAGKPVNEDDIPPPVGMGASVAVENTSESPAASPSEAPSAPVATTPSPTGATAVSANASDSGTRQVLVTRKDQYKKAAMMAKTSGDMDKAKKYVKIAMQFDSVIKAVDEGNPVDLSKMPPVPPEISGGAVTSPNKPQVSIPVERNSNQAAGEKKEETEPDLPQTTAEEEKSMFNAPDAPKTVMEALSQRLEKYKSSESSAKEAGESSKARRMGRIVKQYQDAIKCYKAGRPVDFEELPTPPGFGPIPQGKAPAPAAAPAAAAAPRPQPAVAPQAAARPQPTAAAAAGGPPGPSTQRPAPRPSASGGQAHPPIQRQASHRGTRIEQQLAFLNERKEEFKRAALSAKKKHDVELAKKYIRMAKGLEPMVEALESGLPVDLSQVPQSPYSSEESEDKFIVVSVEDCQPTGDREEVYKTLQADLIRQIRICVSNAQHYQKLGDVPAASKFQKLEQNNRKDLDSLKSAFRHGDPAPRFHYETRSFSMVQCNTELGDGDLDMTIVRGIQYNLPSGYSEKDMDTVVKYELGYPTDEPQTGGTSTVKGSINPEYNESFKLQINRKSKGFFRFIERKSLKCEIYLKRGFFKGDKLIGTVNVKLQPLESQCVLHESYDLMDGRKTVGGKLEVKLRVRDPFKNKQVDEVREKWLVIDQFIRTVGSMSQKEAKAPKAQRAEGSGSEPSLLEALQKREGTMCMEVLRLEKQMLDKQIAQLKDSLSVTQTQALKHKSALIEEKLELQQKKLREGGVEAWKAYYAAVEGEMRGFEQEARQHARVGDVHKAELLLTKKKYAEKEMAAIKAKLPSA